MANDAKYSVKQIANYFLNLAVVDGIPITPLKLQKLVYYAHGWYLGFTHRPLIRESVRAWDYGPVIPDLYDEFRKYGGSPIRELARIMRVIDNEEDDFEIVFEEAEIPNGEEHVFTRDLLKKVWKEYGCYNARQLSSMTHAPGTPWSEVYANSQEKSPVIPNELIEQYFAERIKEGERTGESAEDERLKEPVCEFG